MLCTIICCVRYCTSTSGLFISFPVYLCVHVSILLCVVSLPWDSVRMLLPWDAYDWFYGCFRNSEFFDLFLCLHEVSVMRYVDFCQHSSAF